ncbi:MAG: type II toxin-antitoxin system RelE/ParE family toxin [Serratia liquefaciens]|uniref:type II toxin-antitoxin system RelE/ParE family toxin n=1 Tax=Serratia liquefaciens TaxID=614 RepID=UPI0021CFE70B|nr:type II toxin-antitoxin system RelE/ParE family toxin [Serratia liquefaciens]MDU5486953.1 type II toxin-antitoxin system RelE/ParE family toxin [Serratia liquefaciens]
MASIRSSINILAHHPQAGRPIEDMAIEFREWPNDFGNSGCIALYHFDGSTAVLLAVRHQSEAGY